MSVAATSADKLFAVCFDLGTALWGTLKADTFEEKEMKLQLAVVYAVVAKYRNLWASRDPTNKTYVTLCAIDHAFKQMANMKKGFIGTRVAVHLIAQQDGMKVLAGAIRRTELPGLSGRMAADDRNLLRANLAELVGNVQHVIDDKAPRFATWCKDILAASKLDKAALKARLDDFLMQTGAAFDAAIAADAAEGETDTATRLGEGEGSEAGGAVTASVVAAGGSGGNGHVQDDVKDAAGEGSAKRPRIDE